VGKIAAPGALATRAVTFGIAALNHEPLDDSVEREAVIVAVLGEKPEVLDGLGLLLREELDLEGALARVDHGVQAAGALRAGGDFGIAGIVRRRAATGGPEQRDAEQYECSPWGD